MATGSKDGDAGQKGDKAAAIDRGEDQKAAAQSQAEPHPEQSGVLDWSYAVGRCIWRGFRWVARGLKASDGLITALATVAIFIVAWLQWETFEKTDRTLNKTLLIGQRAFVHLEKIVFNLTEKWSTNEGCCVFNLPRKEGEVIKPEFHLTNSGNTPTKNLKITIQCQPLGVGAKIGDPFDLFKRDGLDVVERSLGAKQTIPISPESCEIKDDDTLMLVQMRMVRRFLVGEITYEDWIEPGRIHRTRFAHELIVRSPGDRTGSPVNTGLTGATLVTNPIGKNNCTDEDCP